LLVPDHDDPITLVGFDETLITELRAALREAKFDDAFLSECEAIAPRMLDAVRLPAVHWWLRRLDRPAAVIARLWAYGDTVNADELSQALDGALAEGLQRVGVLRRHEDGFRGAMRLVPFCGLWIASDEMHGGDPVMGPGATTDELARAIPRDAGRVLDVGCGAGSLALVAASRGATEVVGVDLHPRATEWSRINATLNELPIELHSGDLTAPVKGRTFDLVLSQPPFVVKPAQVQATTYLHGGAMGDELTMRLVAEIPEVLAPEGQARLLFDSPTRADVPLWRRLEQAHDDDSIQQLLFVTPGNSPNIQAIGYAASSHPALGPEYADAVHRYRDHLRLQGIDTCEHALVVLQRRQGLPSMSVTVEQPSLAEVDAEVIAATWAAIALASRPEAELMQVVLGLAPGAWLVQEQACGGDESRLKLRLPPGRGGEEELSDAAALLFDLIGEPAPLSVVIERYAAECEAEPEDVRAGVIDFVRKSLVSGRLVAAEEGSR